MEDPPGGLAVTSASPGRASLATVTLTAVIVALTGSPLVILLSRDGKLPSRRWRPVVAAYLAITVVTVLVITIAVLHVAIGHHVVLQSNGTLASLGSGRTAYAGLIMGAYLL